MFIKKIFENKTDESVHKQFVRFGKGHFERRAIVNVKKNSIVKITTSFEFANDLVAFIATLASWFRVQGIVLSKQPLEDFKGKKKQGLFIYEIAKELGSEELSKLASSCYATLLDCISPEGKIDLKIKKKLPRLRPSAKSGELKIDEKFCQLNLDAIYWKEFHDEFLWDLPREMKKARVEHSYDIEEIIIPKEIKDKDFEQIRQEAKKKGKLLRKAIVDGHEHIKEINFVV